MGFDSGPLSFARFNVVGDAPRMIEQSMLERFEALALREDDATTAEVDYGWCGGRHVFDDNFAFGHNVYDDCLHVGLRVDTNRVPAEIKRAYVALEEQGSKRDDDGAISKAARKIARQSAAERIEQELRSGKFRRSKLTPVLWDLRSNTVFAAVAKTSRDQLIELFERTTDLKLEPVTSTALVRRHAEALGKLRDYEDLSPTRFVLNESADSVLDYPWAPRSDSNRDFLGNELLMWLWQLAQSGNELVLNKRGIVVTFHKSLDLDCIYSTSGKATLKHEMPTSMTEAGEAVRSGKVPRKAGVVLAIDNALFPFSIQAESLSISGLRMPDISEADSPRALFEQRIELLRDFSQMFDELVGRFVDERLSDQWNATIRNIRNWASRRSAPVAQVA